MSKEARALLKKINDMKNAIRGLQGQGKTQEMKDKMDQLREMQQEFDIMMEMDEDEIDDIDDAVKGGKAKGIEGGAAAGAKKYAKADIARAFVNRIVCGLRKRQMTKRIRRSWTPCPKLIRTRTANPTAASPCRRTSRPTSANCAVLKTILNSTSMSRTSPHCPDPA